MNTDDPLESFVERKFAKFVNDLGYYCIKIEKKHWPDRLIFHKNGNHFFIEFKRKGHLPRLGQQVIIDKLRRIGHSVYVCDSYEKALGAYRYESTKI